MDGIKTSGTVPRTQEIKKIKEKNGDVFKNPEKLQVKSTQARSSSSIPTGSSLTFGGGTEYLLFEKGLWHKNLQQC